MGELANLVVQEAQQPKLPAPGCYLPLPFAFCLPSKKSHKKSHPPLSVCCEASTDTMQGIVSHIMSS